MKYLLDTNVLSELVKTFPKIFRGRFASCGETAMCWGFECGRFVVFFVGIREFSSVGMSGFDECTNGATGSQDGSSYSYHYIETYICLCYGSHVA